MSVPIAPVLNIHFMQSHQIKKQKLKRISQQKQKNNINNAKYINMEPGWD